MDIIHRYADEIIESCRRRRILEIFKWSGGDFSLLKRDFLLVLARN